MSPVIILGLVLMWACVLVPMWLRRHDEVEETRSVDRFSTAMHTLSRREARIDERYVVMPHRSRSMDVHVSGASAPDDEEPRVARSERPARPPRRPHRSLPARLLGAVAILAVAVFGLLRRLMSASVAAVSSVVGSGTAAVSDRVRAHERRPMTPAMRRRRTLIGLLLAAVVTLVLAAVVGGLPLWLLQVAADLALGAFVWHLHRRAQRAAAVVRQRRRAAAAQRVPLVEPLSRPAASMARPVPVTLPETAVAAAPAAAPVAPVLADELPLTAEATAGSWEPVPVPPPTYTMKPAAPARPPRTTEYADYSEPLVPPVAQDRDELDDTADLAEILEQRWAVND
jgi:hypothetical protein